MLRDVPVAYRSWGALNPTRDNVVVVCHALTGNTDVDVWWGPLLGEERPLDPASQYIVSLNVPGSPYGSVSPVTMNPDTGRPYAADFPLFTIRDTVSLHRMALEAMGVCGIELAIGASMGGMHALEWAFHTDFTRRVCVIAAGARHSAWSVGWGEAQRRAIFADANWQDGHYSAERAPVAGLAAARMMAMVSYRTPGSFHARFGRNVMDDTGTLAVESYLRYQGDKLVGRFDANCYVQLTRQMDTHDVGRDRISVDAALAGLQQPVLVVGIDSDLLYPLAEQEELARYLPASRLEVLRSEHGHDAFLIEFDRLDEVLRSFMQDAGGLIPVQRRLCS